MNLAWKWAHCKMHVNVKNIIYFAGSLWRLRQCASVCLHCQMSKHLMHLWYTLSIHSFLRNSLFSSQPLFIYIASIHVTITDNRLLSHLLSPHFKLIRLNCISTPQLPRGKYNLHTENPVHPYRSETIYWSKTTRIFLTI